MSIDIKTTVNPTPELSGHSSTDSASVLGFIALPADTTGSRHEISDNNLRDLHGPTSRLKLSEPMFRNYPDVSAADAVRRPVAEPSAGNDGGQLASATHVDKVPVDTSLDLGPNPDRVRFTDKDRRDLHGPTSRLSLSEPMFRKYPNVSAADAVRRPREQWDTRSGAEPLADTATPSGGQHRATAKRSVLPRFTRRARGANHSIAAQ